MAGGDGRTDQAAGPDGESPNATAAHASQPQLHGCGWLPIWRHGYQANDHFNTEHLIQLVEMMFV